MLLQVSQTGTVITGYHLNDNTTERVDVAGSIARLEFQQFWRRVPFSPSRGITSSRRYAVVGEVEAKAKVGEQYVVPVYEYVLGFEVLVADLLLVQVMESITKAANTPINDCSVLVVDW
jgi:hypothetical protein